VLELNKSIRLLFPALGNYKAYLNTASTGLMPSTTVEFIHRLVSEASINTDLDEYLNEIKSNAKREISKLINAKPSEIAFMVQTTECVKKALLMSNPDNKTAIISVDIEFPTVTSSIESICEFRNCKQLVLNTNFEENLEDEIEEAIKNSVFSKYIVLISSVNWITGFKLDIKEVSRIVHEHGGILIVDGVQHVGALSIDVRKEDADVLCCGGEKWILTPYYGIGFMYIKEELISKLDLPPYGIQNRKEPEYKWSNYWPDPSKDPWHLPEVSITADKYEWGGGSPFIPIAALWKSVELINNIEVKSIQNHVLKLRSILVERLLEKGFSIMSSLENANRFSPILLFATGRGLKKDMDLVKTLRSKRVMVSYRGAKGLGGIRVSPHLYNTVEDIELLMSEVDNAKVGID
jgi:cysteine desulfurase/selenocysteine lyase